MNSSCLLSHRTMRRDNARRRLEAGTDGATIALLLFAGTVVHAEQAPCLRLAERHIDSAQLKNFQATSATHVAAMTRLEPGILAFHAVVEKNDPTRIRVIEMYRDETAHGTHLQSPHFQAFLATTRSMVVEHPWFDVVPVHIGSKKALPPSPVVRVADLEVLPAQPNVDVTKEMIASRRLLETDSPHLCIAPQTQFPGGPAFRFANIFLLAPRCASSLS